MARSQEEKDLRRLRGRRRHRLRRLTRKEKVREEEEDDGLSRGRAAKDFLLSRRMRI